MNVLKTQLYRNSPAQENAHVRIDRNISREGVTLSRAEDQIELSPRAKLMTRIKKAALETEDIRPDKVACFKDQVMQGKLSIDPDKIADKMLEELF